MNKLFNTILAMIIASSMLFGTAAQAKEDMRHKVVIQVSTADPVTQKIALNNAVNVQKSLGMDNVDVEVVAYGPGLSLLTKKSKEAQRIASLAMQDNHNVTPFPVS